MVERWGKGCSIRIGDAVFEIEDVVIGVDYGSGEPEPTVLLKACKGRNSYTFPVVRVRHYWRFKIWWFIQSLVRRWNDFFWGKESHYFLIDNVPHLKDDELLYVSEHGKGVVHA